VSRTWRQRFDVTGGGSGPSGMSSGDAYDEILKAEAKAIDDFRKGLITADDAIDEFVTSMRKYGRSAGVPIDERKADVSRMESILDRLASAMGQAGVTKESLPVTRLSEQAEAEERMWKAINEAMEQFKQGLITADEANRRQAAAVDQFGEKAKYLVGERDAVKKDNFKDLSGAAQGMGVQGPTDPNSVAGGLQQLIGRFLPGNSPVAGMLKNNSLMSMLGGGGGGAAGGAMSGAAGGAMGAIGAAAGPLAAVAAGAKVMEGFYQSVQAVTRKMGDIGTAIAKNDGVGAITGFIDGVGEAYGKVPIIGGMLKEQIGQYSQFIKTFDQVTTAFEQRGREIAKFDARIAGAEAEANVVKLLSDIKEAQQLGNEYAALIQEKATMQAELQQALTPIKRIITQQLVVALRIVNFHLEAIGKLSQNFDDSMQKMSAGINGMVGDVKNVSAFFSQGGALLLQFIKMAPWVKKERVEDNELLRRLFDLSEMDMTVSKEYMPEREPPPPLGIDLFR